jgi:dephospho-CoA kinase
MSGLPNICLVGEAGAGKTTVAELLVKNFGYTRVSFAWAVKVMLDTETDRERLQEFGTDVVRAYEPQAWVRLFLAVLELRGDGPFVVDDARFYNEVAGLIQDDWITCRVAAPVEKRIQRLKENGKFAEGMFRHSSEMELAGYRAQHRILNDGWVDFDLLPDVEAFINKVQAP